MMTDKWKRLEEAKASYLEAKRKRDAALRHYNEVLAGGGDAVSHDDELDADLKEIARKHWKQRTFSPPNIINKSNLINNLFYRSENGPQTGPQMETENGIQY